MVKFRRKPVKKEKYVCEGGPLDGYHLWLSEGSTGVFRVNGQTGKYVAGKFNRIFNIVIWEEV